MGKNGFRLTEKCIFTSRDEELLETMEENGFHWLENELPVARIRSAF